MQHTSMLKNIRLFVSLSIAILMIGANGLFASVAKAPAQHQVQGFIRNAGQFNATSDTKVLFKMPDPGMDLYITNKGFRYVFKELVSGNSDETALQIDQIRRENPMKAKTIRYSVVDALLLNANISTNNMVSEEKSMPKITYYLDQARGGVIETELHHKVRFVGVYPGIDWVIFIQNGQVKYDFEVQAGADPSLIRMQYDGDARLAGLNNMQMLQINNALGEIKEGKLLCYDTHSNRVACTYKIEGKQVSFVPSGYNKHEKLVIDPPIAWSTYMGGTADESALTLTHDAEGNIYVGGQTTSTDFPVSGGAFLSNGGLQDGFLAKFNNVGKMLWSTYIGGSGNENINDVLMMPNGDLLAIGVSGSNDFPVYAGTTMAYNQATFGGGTTDAVLMRFSSGGSRLWASYFGGSNQDSGNNSALDPQGNIYFTGATWSSNLPTMNPGGAAYFDGTYGGNNSDAYLAKLDASGTLTWATYYGGSAGDAGIDLAVDQQGNVFVTGNTYSTDLNVKDAGSGSFYQPTLKGGLDVMMLKFASDGSLKWATYYGGTGGDSRASAIRCDSQGKVYVVGRTGTGLFPVTDLGNGAYFSSQLGGGMFSTPYVMRFDNQGKSEWSSYLIGSNTGWTYDLAISSSNQLYITGETRASDFSTLDKGDGSYFQSGILGSLKYDAFLMEFNPSAVLKWSTYLGGSLDDRGNCITVDPFNFVFVGGFAKSTDFPVVTAGDDSFYSATIAGGTQDMFITKFGSNSVELPVADFSFVTACSGDTVQFTDLSTGNPMAWEWNFGDPASGAQNTSTEQHPGHVFSSGGNYTVRLKAINAMGNDTKQITFQVTQTVQGVISGLDTVYCNNHTAITMTGSPAGGTFSGNGVSGNVFLPKEANMGMNLIVYTPPAGNCVKPAQVWVRVKTGAECQPDAITDASLLAGAQIFPNPFTNNIVIQMPVFAGKASLVLKDISGKTVWQGNSVLQSGQNHIALPGLSQGVYFLQLSFNGTSASFPLIRLED